MKYNLLYLLVLIEPEYINTSWTPVSHWTDADGQTPNRYNFKIFDFSIEFIKCDLFFCNLKFLCLYEFIYAISLF